MTTRVGVKPTAQLSTASAVATELQRSLVLNARYLKGNMQMDRWPFSDPGNTAAITLRQIIEGNSPILHVTHDAEDGQWQFLGWLSPEEDDAVIVGLGRVVSVDPTICELADLPLGWHAWRRSIHDPWQRAPSPTSE